MALLLALAFEFVNGFHDTANAVATVIYTKSLRASVAVIWSGIWNLIGVLSSSGAVAFGVVALLPVELVLNVGTGAGFAMVFALLIAAIQGVLGGTAFALTRLPAPVFMGVLIGFFSIVPVVGSALIWAPAALWLGLNGSWGKAALVAIICGGVAGVADNVVRPLLLRNRTRLNDLLLFISILGGLQVFGLLGLVAGPTIVAAALGVFQVYMQHRDERDAAGA